MLSYLLETTLCWAGFFALYSWLLRNTTFFQLNRWYLLGTLLLGAVVPLVPLPEWSPEPAPIAYYLSPIKAGVQQVEIQVQALPSREGLPWLQIVVGLYLAGLSFTLFRLGYGLRKIWLLYRRSEKVVRPGYTLVLTPEAHLPFSFFRLMFWSKRAELDESEERSIQQHERAHIEGWHSLDVLLTELLCAVFWCSPLVYFYRRSLRQVHEYLADRAVLQAVRPRVYGRFLLRQAQHDLQLAFAHHLLQSPLKKRIDMMTRRQSRRGALIRYALTLPLLILFLLAFANRSLIGQTLMEIHRPDGTIEKHQVDSNHIPENLVNPSDIQSVNVSKQDGTSRIVVRLKPDRVGTVNIEEVVVTALAPQDSDAFGPVNLEELVIVGYAPEAGATFKLPAEQATFTPEYRIYRSDGTVTAGPSAAAEAKALQVERIERVDVRKGIEGEQDLVEIYMKGYASTVADRKGPEVDQMPRYPGCEDIGADGNIKQECAKEKLFGYLSREIRYPADARQAAAEGVVVIEFTVAADGQVKSPRVMRSLHPSCDAEALRVVNAMPEWIPGRKDGKAVAVKLQLPFTFKITPKPEETPKPAADARQLKLQGFTASPNPTSGRLNVRFQGEAGPLTIQVTDLQGRRLLARSFADFNGNFDEQLDLSAISNGPVLLSIMQGEKVYTQQVVLQR